MSKVRVRVDSKRMSPHASKQEQMYNLTKLLRAFKRACNDYGIGNAFNDHRFFERKCDKRRKKEIARKIAAAQDYSIENINQKEEYNNGW